MQWTKEIFIEDLHKNASLEVSKISETLCDFAEEKADEVAWGRGSDYGTVSFRANSDFGPISLYLLTSRGKIKFFRFTFWSMRKNKRLMTSWFYL